MKPFKNLMGNGAKEQEQLEAMRAVLADIQRERERYETLVEGSKAGAERLKQLGEPLAKTESEMHTLEGRMAQMQERFQAMVKLADLFNNLDERAEGLTKSTQWAESRLSTALEGSQKIESTMADLVSKVDLAADLKERLTGFLEVEKPFQLLRGEAESLHGQLEGAAERVARLRDQHDRLLDAHKSATTKLEAMDRRRDELGRSLQDKERRVESVEASVKSMDGVHQTINQVKREVITLKSLGDSVAQKTAALEAHREALDRALAQTEHLDRAMRTVDAGVRQQKENEKALATFAEQVAALRALHEAVIDRSNEVTQLQRQAHEQTVATRQDLASMSDEMKSTVERFDFEARGLESVSQRVADLRGDLSTCENRFKGLQDSSLTMGELKHQVDSVSAQLLSMSQEVSQVDREVGKLHAIRRDLDATSNTARAVSEQVARIEASRAAVDAGLKDLTQLAGAHALVRDALEQIQLVQDEITRARQGQSETRTWLGDVVVQVADLRQRFTDLKGFEPALESVRNQAQRIQDATTSIELRKEFVDNLQRRLSELGSLTARIDERGQQLAERMDAAEQRFASLGHEAATAEQVAGTIAGVNAKVEQAALQADDVQKTVKSLQERCESVEAIASETKALRKEIEQRHRALAEAAKELKQTSSLRQEAADAASQLDELANRLTSSLGTADQRVNEVDELTSRLEDRTQNLGAVEKRLDEFQSRMSKWDVTEQEIARSLEQIASRQGTIDSLQGDLDRMFAMAEKTSIHVREITSAHAELEQSRGTLKDVLAQLKQLRDGKSTLEERKRQITQAEERLSRADALLVEVRSGLEILEGQKVLVEQAVEKAGSLQSLLRQADAAVGNLREANRTSVKMRGTIVDFPGPQVDDDEDEEDIADAA
jgi:chromosome segregation ATPase